MSVSALLTAVRDKLRATVPLTDFECSVQPDEKPFPEFGKRYVSIHSESWSPGDADLDKGLDELYGVGCTITQRLSGIPIDRRADEIFLHRLIGIEQLARKIMVNIHRNWDIVTEANKLIEDQQELMQPLFWKGTDATPRIVDATWMFSDPSVFKGNAGMVLGVHFGEARRMQNFSSMK